MSEASSVVSDDQQLMPTGLIFQSDVEREEYYLMCERMKNQYNQINRKISKTLEHKWDKKNLLSPGKKESKLSQSKRHFSRINQSSAVDSIDSKQQIPASISP